MAALLLVAAGQPLFAEDTWWHLSMGAAHARSGPWLDADPLLHTAAGPPAPAAWLFDLALHGVERAFGFQGLRLLHAGLVAAILLTAWTGFRRFGASAEWASLGTLLFGAVSAYRLFQLRPHLLTILATLVVLRLLLARDPPGWGRVALAAALFVPWANVHGGFLVGLALLGAAAAGALAASLWEADAAARLRTRRLVAAFGLALLASFANPSGASQHLLYFRAGAETPDLAVVADEWAPFGLLAWPGPGLPRPFVWAAVWAVLLLWAGLALRATRPGRRASAQPALLAASAAAWVGLLAALRLVWLSVVPMWWIGGRLRATPALRALAAAVALASLAGFLLVGDWPGVSRAISRDTWAEPYPANKLDGHAVWFLADAGLEGKLWNDYAQGNFLGYWLAPRMRVFLNGSLNVPHEVMQARRAVRTLDPPGGETLTDLLDRYDVDVFFGTGLPAWPPPGRSEASTATHLEGEPGWILVFRNLRSALYLRDLPRNRENLARVVDYYARAGVPFDPRRGFDTAAVLAEAPRWAFDHGLRPALLPALQQQARAGEPAQRRAALERLGALYAALGLYERSLEIEDRRLAEEPGAIRAQRRRLWSLLHLGRRPEAAEAAEALAARAAPGDPISAALVAFARRAVSSANPSVLGRVALFPVFAPDEVPAILTGVRPAEARRSR